MKNLITSTLMVAALMSSNTNQVSAGNVTVNNENATSIVLKLVPAGAPKDFTLEKQVPANNTFQFDVSSDDLAGKSLYALEGKTNPFMGDKCKNLSIDKNYTVTFINDTMGTTCVAHEKSMN